MMNCGIATLYLFIVVKMIEYLTSTFIIPCSTFCGSKTAVKGKFFQQPKILLFIYNSFINIAISLTALSIPTRTALETILWPMLNSSISLRPLKAFMVL